MTAHFGARMQPPIEGGSRAVDSSAVAAAVGQTDPIRKVDPEQSIAVLDSRALAGESLAGSLAAHCPRTFAAAVTSIQEWKDQKQLHPPLAAILVNISGRDFADQDLVDEVRQLICEFAPVPIVVLADNEDPQQIVKGLEHGVRGYIPASVGIDVCIQAIRLAIAGGTFVPATSLLAMKQALCSISNERPSLTTVLSLREAAVAEALCRGKSNKIIAYELNLCESTVKVHVRSIMKKLKATNRAQAAYKIDNLFGPSSQF